LAKVWLFAACLVVLGAPANALGDQIDDAVASQRDKLSSDLGFPLSVSFSTGATEISDSSTINLSRTQLLGILNRAGAKSMKDAVGLIMAHEAGHLVQNRLYNGAYDSASLEDKRVFECQADVLAGKFLIESLPRYTPDTSGSDAFAADVRRRTNAILDALQILYNVGSPSDASPHPTPDQRQECVRLGMAAGTMVVGARDFGSENPAPEIIAQKIDWLPAGPMPWSLDRAKLILHYSKLAVANLRFTLIKNETSSGAVQTVAYSIICLNSGSRPVDVRMDVQVLAVPHEDSSSERNTELLSNKQYLFRVQPDGEVHIADKQSWESSTLRSGALHAHLSVPPSPGSLISATYASP